jgi:hypothetical protein
VTDGSHDLHERQMPRSPTLNSHHPGKVTASSWPAPGLPFPTCSSEHMRPLTYSCFLICSLIGWMMLAPSRMSSQPQLFQSCPSWCPSAQDSAWHTVGPHGGVGEWTDKSLLCTFSTHSFLQDTFTRPPGAPLSTESTSWGPSPSWGPFPPSAAPCMGRKIHKQRNKGDVEWSGLSSWAVKGGGTEEVT